MKKNMKRQPRTRLQSLDSAQLAQVAGGASMCDLAGQWADDTGWHEFFDAAGGCTTYYTCTPRWN